MGKKKDESLELIDECITDAKALMSISLFNAQEKLKERFTPQLKSLIAKKLQQEEEEEDEDIDSLDAVDDDELEDADIEDVTDVDDVDDDELDLDIEDDELDSEIEDDEIEDDELDDDSDEDMAVEDLEDTELDIEVDDDEEDDMDYEDDEEEDEELDLESIMNSMDTFTEDDDEELDIEDDEDEELGIEDDEDDEIDMDIEDDEEDIDEEIDIEDDDDDEDIDIDIDDEDEDADEMQAENLRLTTELKKYKAGARLFKEKIAEQKFVQAKLLYVNDMLKRKHLSEMQKYKIVEAFDRADSISDIKIIYKTLHEAYKERQAKIKDVTKKSLKEGSASKAILSDKQRRKTILKNKKVNPMKDRFQVLARIKK